MNQISYTSNHSDGVFPFSAEVTLSENGTFSFSAEVTSREDDTFFIFAVVPLKAVFFFNTLNISCEDDTFSFALFCYVNVTFL